MAGKSLQLFADLLATTNANSLKNTSESGILSEVQNQTYLTSAFMKGKSAADVVKAGKDIRAYSQFAAGTQSEFYLPGATFNNSVEDIDSTLIYYFRYLHDAFVYTKHEIEHNSSSSDEFGINTRLIDIMKSKRQGMKISTFNTIEASWWTTPALATMETAATANRPYSIRTWITEDGLAPSTFTTIGNINPSTQSLWRNQVSNYTAGSIDTTLISAFDEMWKKVDFEAPPTMQAYLNDTKLSKFLIPTDINGSKIYQRLTRQSNNHLIGSGKDVGAYSGDLPYNGIPVKYVKQMDAIGYSSTQPRYFWINTEFLYPVWHTSAYFQEEEPMTSQTAPYTYVVHSDTWYQLICKSRQRQGIIVPA